MEILVIDTTQTKFMKLEIKEVNETNTILKL